ncbi:MAG: macro domain-containing protein [Candidatus Syntrophoarchaeum sp.]|nr:macro domain-containing protein [Candidatus Syntrophoarchaeum sp.]
MRNVTYSVESVFNEGTQTIVNTVNCVGVMGAGLALEFKLRYPEMFEDYVNRCQNNKVKIGEPYIYKYDDVWILNFPTKIHWRDKSKLDWIEKGLIYFRDNYRKMGIQSIAFPKLGTNKGGLKWEEVNKLMKAYLDSIDIPFYICLDTAKSPKGVEKYMTDYLNNLSLNELITEFKIQKNIARRIVLHVPLKKFRDILFIEGVGKRTYETLFRSIYIEIKEKEKMYHSQARISDF